MYTKGEWDLEEIPYETNDPAGGWYLHFDPTGDTTEDVLYMSKAEVTEANAHLIAAAVNGCIKVNPDNPQAVAESIKDMYEALKTASGYLTFLASRNNPIPKSDSVRDLYRKALSKAEGR